MSNENLNESKSNSALHFYAQNHSLSSSLMKSKFSSNDTYNYSQEDDEDRDNENAADDDMSAFFESKKLSRTKKSGEVRKTLVAVVYFGFICLTKAFVQTIVHDRVPDMKKYPPLPDLILDNLPLMPWAFFASELIGLFFGVLFFTTVLFHKHR